MLGASLAVVTLEFSKSRVIGSRFSGPRKPIPQLLAALISCQPQSMVPDSALASLTPTGPLSSAPPGTLNGLLPQLSHILASLVAAQQTCSPDNPRDRDGITLPVFPFWLLDITQPTDWNDSCPLVVRYVLQWRRAANIIFDPLPNEDGGLRLGYRD